VHVASARCAISNYLPVHSDGLHGQQFLFQRVRNAAGDTSVVASNNGRPALVSVTSGGINVSVLRRSGSPL